MPSRRSHTKSRHGCLECKAKKVKCDQGKPTCARCTKSKQPCHYGVVSGKPCLSPTSLASGVNNPSPKLPWGISRFPSPVDPLETQQGTFTASDLNLMHHYSTVKFLPLAPNGAETEIWQKLAPEEAFKHRFLLYGILAFAALHKAYLYPATAPENTLLAMQHYTTAISLFRPVLSNIQPDNAVAAFLLSGLVVCISWALPMTSSDSMGNALVLTTGEKLQHILDIMRLLRGVREIVESGQAWTQQLAPIFNLVANEPDSIFPPDEEVILQALEQRVYAEVESPAENDMYSETLRNFRRYWPVEHSPYAHGLVYAWTTQNSNEFLNAILERRPPALLILAYHGALLHELTDCWWVGDKGRVIVQIVEELLPVGYKDIMEWPKMRAAQLRPSMNAP